MSKILIALSAVDKKPVKKRASEPDLKVRRSMRAYADAHKAVLNYLVSLKRSDPTHDFVAKELADKVMEAADDLVNATEIGHSGNTHNPSLSAGADYAPDKAHMLSSFRELCKDLSAARSPSNKVKLLPKAVADIEKRIRAAAKKLEAHGIHIPANRATRALGLSN